MYIYIRIYIYMYIYIRIYIYIICIYMYEYTIGYHNEYIEYITTTGQRPIFSRFSPFIPHIDCLRMTILRPPGPESLCGRADRSHHPLSNVPDRLAEKRIGSSNFGRPRCSFCFWEIVCTYHMYTVLSSYLVLCRI